MTDIILFICFDHSCGLLFQVLASRFISYGNFEDMILDVIKGKTVMLLNRLFLEYAAVSPLIENQEDPKRTLRILKVNEYLS